MAPTGILHYGITAMLSQLTYCATSFARLGFDFHMLLLPLFDMRCARVSGKLSRAVEFARASETSWAAVGAPRGGAGTAGGTLFEAPRTEARGAATAFLPLPVPFVRKELIEGVYGSSTGDVRGE
jgi:hypothetical protein